MTVCIQKKIRLETFFKLMYFTKRFQYEQRQYVSEAGDVCLSYILRQKHIFPTGESAGLEREMEAGGGVIVFL